MSLESELKRRNGVARTTEIQRLGYTQHAIREAVRAGKVVRPQRGWLAIPGQDPELIFAARHGVVLSCITQATRLGLWVLRVDRPHVAGSLTARNTSAPDCTVHWRKPLVPRQPSLLTDHLENVLDVVAACQPFEVALAIWDSAMQKNLIDYHALKMLPLRGRSTALLAECTPFADSGLESIVRTRLRWLPVPVRIQATVRGRRVDVLIGDRLVLQIDGKHHQGVQRASDMEHDAELIQHGYTVLRMNYAQIVYKWAEVEARILGAIARGKHLAVGGRH